MLPPGGADTNDFVAAINAAIAASASDGGPSIINMSVGFSGVNTTVENRIQAALNAGITVVVAAGNDNRSACLGTPERMPGVITVAASNIDDTRLPQSNYGNCVDLFAPGGGIAAGHQSNSQEVGFGGTSAAAPMVAGIAALHLEDNESHTPAQVANAIINGSTLNVITNRGCVNPPSGNCSPNRLAYSLLAGPPAGTLQFSSATFTSSEVTPAVSITVTRSVNTSGPVSVTVVASNGSATAGSDYSAPSAVLNWGNGDGAPKVFTVNVTDDAIYEGNETVNLTLQSPSGGAVLGSPATAVLTINENDPPPGTIVLSAANYEGPENGGSITITAMRTGGNGGAVSAQYNSANGSAVAPSDYGTASGTLNWANGDTANKTFIVIIGDDAVAEPNETFSVSLTNPTGGATIGSPSGASVKIVDNDTPIPSTPASIWTDPLGESYTGNWQVVWNPAIGPVNYYSLEETSDLGVVNHTIPYPSAFKDYTHQVFYRRFYFRVKACNVNDQCSSYTAQTFIDVCGSGVCP